jgi:hypothetical protein|nr:MAG TPA: Protein of unknown function (DUF1778) [Caudoviricetes sp.]
MPCTEAQKRGNAAYNRRQDNIMIRPSKDKGGAIRTAAAAAGQSVQAYVLQACFERMQRDGFTPPAAPDAGDDKTP